MKLLVASLNYKVHLLLQDVQLDKAMLICLHLTGITMGTPIYFERTHQYKEKVFVGLKYFSRKLKYLHKILGPTLLVQISDWFKFKKSQDETKRGKQDDR